MKGAHPKRAKQQHSPLRLAVVLTTTATDTPFPSCDALVTVEYNK